MNTDEPNTNEINADECDFIKFLNNELKIGENRIHAKKMDSSISNDDKLSLCNVDMYIKTSCYTEAINIIKSLIREKCNREIIPLLYRKVIFYAAYCIYIDKYEYNRLAIYKDKNDEIKIKNQSDVLKILELHKDSFNKWGMDSPFFIYKKGNDIGIKINLYRHGKKNRELCYIINQLIDQAKPSILAEGFCGLATVTVSRKRDMKVILNDGDNIIVNFLKAVKEHPKELKKECNFILKEIELSKENKKSTEAIYNEELDKMLKSNPKALDDRDNVEKFIRNFIKNISKIDIEKCKPIVQSAIRVYKEKQALKTKYSGKDIPIDKQIKVAGAFYFLHSFGYNGTGSVSSITEKSLKMYEKNLRQISDYSKALKCVGDIYNEDIVNFIDIFNKENDKLNKKDILLYLDPPYPGTRGYDVKTYENKFFDKLSEVKCKLIFSYREKVNKATKEKKPDCLLRYFRSMRDHISTNLYVLLTNNPQKEIIITNFDFDLETIDRGTFYFISKFSNKFKKANTYEKLSFEDFLKKLGYKN